MDTFKTVVEAAKAAGAEAWLPALVEADMTRPTALATHGADPPVSGMPAETWRQLRSHCSAQLPGAGRGRPTRKDHPVAQPSTGGSLARALAAAASNERDTSLQLLKNDIYSQSNSGPQASRMKTWRQIAAAWKLPPLPLTPELIQAVGASFKRGGYRSASLYFSTARKEHILQYGTLSQDVEIIIKDVIRSIERGQGPSKLKDSFNLRDLATIDLSQESEAFRIDFNMVILGSFFLTREIELSATLRRHVRLDEARMTVSWTLPATKTCTQGELTERTHKCMCKTLPQQLCPYHCMVDTLILTTPAYERTDDGPLFFEGYSHMSKVYTIDAIRAVLKKANIPTQREGAEGTVERFHGHCLRISGSQALIRMGFNTTLVMLLGRWGSQAILRYIQDSPLQELIDVDAESEARERGKPKASIEPELKKLKTEQKFVKEAVTSLQHRCDELAREVAELNTTPPYVVGKKAHRPDPREKELPPMAWTKMWLTLRHIQIHPVQGGPRPM